MPPQFTLTWYCLRALDHKLLGLVVSNQARTDRIRQRDQGGSGQDQAIFSDQARFGFPTA
jgi:hypothetical protein